MNGSWSDYEELRALTQRYARAADQRDVADLRALFEPDAVVEGVRGRLSLDQWLAAMSTPPSHPGSMHLIGEPLIEIDAAARSARLDTYAVIYGRGAEERPDMTMGIRYLDRAVRSDAGWRIAERSARVVWTG